MKIDLNKPFIGLDGTIVKSRKPNGDEDELYLGKVLAGHLDQHNKGDALKFLSWALKLIEGKELDLDKSDQEVLITFIKNNEGLNNLFKGRVINLIEDIKESAKSSKSKD